jgi:hypothetical protein
MCLKCYQGMSVYVAVDSNPIKRLFLSILRISSPGQPTATAVRADSQGQTLALIFRAQYDSRSVLWNNVFWRIPGNFLTSETINVSKTDFEKERKGGSVALKKERALQGADVSLQSILLPKRPRVVSFASRNLANELACRNLNIYYLILL